MFGESEVTSWDRAFLLAGSGRRCTVDDVSADSHVTYRKIIKDSIRGISESLLYGYRREQTVSD